MTYVVTRKISVNPRYLGIIRTLPMAWNGMHGSSMIASTQPCFHPRIHTKSPRPFFIGAFLITKITKIENPCPVNSFSWSLLPGASCIIQFISSQHVSLSLSLSSFFLLVCLCIKNERFIQPSSVLTASPCLCSTITSTSQASVVCGPPRGSLLAQPTITPTYGLPPLSPPQSSSFPPLPQRHLSPTSPVHLSIPSPLPIFGQPRSLRVPASSAKSHVRVHHPDSHHILSVLLDLVRDTKGLAFPPRFKRSQKCESFACANSMLRLLTLRL